MQLQLLLDDRPAVLAESHRRLRRHFGPQGPFYLLDPVSQLAMGMIGARTQSAISKAAFEALLLRFGAWPAVRDAPADEIYQAIRAVTFAERKAGGLKAVLQAVTNRCGALTLDGLERLSVDEALAWLERLPGVGRKISAATLNFSTLRKATLVIDTHQLRILRRLGFVDRRAGLRQAYERVMPLLPPDWSAAALDEHHQLMKTHGQRICRHAGPICHRCPLVELCPSALSWPEARGGPTARLPTSAVRRAG